MKARTNWHMTMFHYPRKDRSPNDVFTQVTFELAHAHMMSWHQAAGAFGDLHLHACWGESSVLSRHYHGQSIYTSHARMVGFMSLYNRTREVQWKLLVDDIVSNILYLQTPAGGFYHASSEYEPTYRDDQTCPIHQGLPVLALLRYAGWEHADPMRKGMIKQAVDRHWRWLHKNWWRRGNGWKAPLDLPGFCGVTNQDLVIVAWLALYAQNYGDSSLYESFGLPTLETYLSHAYYHESLGLFERGDKPNFAERTTYYDVIVPMLHIVQSAMPHPRIAAVIDNVARQIFASAYIADDGLTHMSYGTDTLPDDKSRIVRWVRNPRPIGSYPGFVGLMDDYLSRNPDIRLQSIHDQLRQTIAAYTFADGTLPFALGGDPLFSLASRSEPIWLYLIRHLGDQLQSPRTVPVPAIQRTWGDTAFDSNSTMWRIRKNGQQLFAGLKQNPGGVTEGPNGVVPGADFSRLDHPEYAESFNPVDETNEAMTRDDETVAEAELVAT